MNAHKILRMTAGKELDALIGKEVMDILCVHELHAYEKDNKEDGDYTIWRCRKCKKTFKGLMYHLGWTGCPNYSTYILDAWKILDKFAYYELKRLYSRYDVYIENDDNKRYGHSQEDSAELAICKAALHASLPLTK